MKNMSFLIPLLWLIANIAAAQTVWNSQNSGTTNTFYSVHFADEDNGCASGISGTVITTGNGGETWTMQNPPSTTSFWGNYCINANTFLVFGSGGTIYKTSDGGQNWAQKQTGSILTLQDAFFLDEQTGWIVGMSESVFKTEDGGENWTLLTSGSAYTFYGVWFFEGMNGFAVGTYGTLKKTEDGGNTWILVPSNTTKNLYSITFVNDLVGFIAGHGGILLKTIDGGATWNPYTIPSNISLRAITFPGEMDGYAVGNGGKILETHDQGLSWTIQSSPFTGQLWDIFFPDPYHGWYVGGGGVVYHTSSIPPVTADFSADITSGPVPLQVQFTDLSTGNVAGWEWDFDNDGTIDSYDQNPTWTYDSAGIYSVVLKVTDGANWFTETKDDFIAVFYELDLRIFLEGPYLSAGSMYHLLYGLPEFPQNQPYNSVPWEYSGTETLTAPPTAGVVDWVLVELRDTDAPQNAVTATRINRMACLLMADGSILSADGASGLKLFQEPVQSLFPVVWHRNHLPVLAAQPMALNGAIWSYDFTTGSDKIFGGLLGCRELEPGIWGMAGGDGDASEVIANPDKVDVWSVQAGNSGYHSGDYNLNGEVQNDDKIDVWTQNAGMGSQVPDAFKN